MKLFLLVLFCALALGYTALRSTHTGLHLLVAAEHEVRNYVRSVARGQ